MNIEDTLQSEQDPTIAEIRKYANKLCSMDREVPDGWRIDPIQKALVFRPVLSDLIFNYLFAVVRPDADEMELLSSPSWEVETALSLLTEVVGGILLSEGYRAIGVEDIANHYCTR